MMKRYLAFLFISILSISSAFAQISGPGVGGGSSGGGISGPGTTVSGNLVTWNSTTGAAIADSGVALSNVPTFSSTATGAYNGSISVNSTTQFTGFLGYTGATNTFSLEGTGAANDNGTLQLFNAGVRGVQIRAVSSSYIQNSLSIGQSANAYPLDVVGNIHTTTGLLITGSSTGIDTIKTANNSINSYTFSLPNEGANDTLMTLGAAQTVSGAITYSGALISTGALTAPAAAGQTTINGTSGTTATMGATNTGIALGGVYSSGVTTGVAGQGAIYMYGTAYGLTLQGWGSNYDVCMAGHSGSCVVIVKNNGTVGIVGATTFTSTVSATGYASTGTVPTTTTGSCTTVGAATGGANAGKFATTASCGSGTTIILSGLPAATAGYTCDAHDQTTPATYINQTASTTNSATFTTSAATGVTDTISYKCMGW